MTRPATAARATTRAAPAQSLGRRGARAAAAPAAVAAPASPATVIRLRAPIVDCRFPASVPLPVAGGDPSCRRNTVVVTATPTQLAMTRPAASPYIRTSAGSFTDATTSTRTIVAETRTWTRAGVRVSPRA